MRLFYEEYGFVIRDCGIGKVWNHNGVFVRKGCSFEKKVVEVREFNDPGRCKSASSERNSVAVDGINIRPRTSTKCG